MTTNYEKLRALTVEEFAKWLYKFIDENIIAPVKKGQVVGKVIYSIKNQKICEIPLISGESIEKVSLKVMINKIWRGILFGIL